jgi:hypothetical protein
MRVVSIHSAPRVRRRLHAVQHERDEIEVS